MHDFSHIYASALGFLNPEAQIPWVANAFEEGSFCSCEYDKMRSAYARICTRLHVQDEDPDLNTIVEAMEHIQQDLCQRMFYLGIQYSQQGEMR